MTKQETVKITVTVELPKKAKELLEEFAESTNTTVEDIFVEQIVNALTNFYSGGFCERWTKGLEKYAKEIEKQFDC